MVNGYITHEGQRVYQMVWRRGGYDEEPFSLPYPILGFKTAMYRSPPCFYLEDCLVVLLIPRRTRMICPRVESPLIPNIDQKTRCELARVHAILRSDGSYIDRAVSGYDPSFTYRCGTDVAPVFPFSDVAIACASGIHFYTTMRGISHTDLRMAPHLVQKALGLERALW